MLNWQSRSQREHHTGIVGVLDIKNQGLIRTLGCLCFVDLLPRWEAFTPSAMFKAYFRIIPQGSHVLSQPLALSPNVFCRQPEAQYLES